MTPSHPSPALFIGRFQPLHLGHLDAIRQMLQKHQRIIIGIGSAQYSAQPKNPYPSTLRKKMIIQALKEEKIPARKFTIIKIPDIHDDAKWVTHVEKLSPHFGEVWSGTTKVRKLFQKDGKHPVVAPKMRRKISGTEIRHLKKTEKKWRHLVPLSTYKLLCP